MLTNHEISRLGSLLAAAAGGGLLWSAFPNINFIFGAPLGTMLLLFALGRNSATWNLLVGTVFGLTFFAPLLWWASVSVGPIPWVALSIAKALYLGVVGVLFTWARRGRVISISPGWQAGAFTVLWAGMEEVGAYFPFGGFPWGRVAFSQVDTWLVRYAALGGTVAVTLATVGIGALAWATINYISAGRGLKAALAGWGAAVVVLAATIIPLPSQAESGSLSVAAIQGNVPDRGLDAFATAREVVQNHRDETLNFAEAGAGTVDIVLWPENGADIDPRKDALSAQLINESATAAQAPLLLGTIEYPTNGGRYNLMLLWEAESQVLGEYRKQRPAPFAEYVPMRDFARLFSDAVDRVTTDMIPGTEPAIMALPVERLGRDVQLAIGICFEVAFDDVLREGVALGGEILIVPTNNANFGRTAESTQQLAMTRLRAIEHGRSAVQISTVGVSGLVAPNGVLMSSTELFTQDYLTATLPLRTTLTLATKLGFWPALFTVALALAVVISGAAGAVKQPSAATKRTGSAAGNGRPAAATRQKKGK